MRGFRLKIEQLEGGAVSVALQGELDLEHAYTFDEELKRVEAREPTCLVLDLRDLTFLASCGLARLLAAHKRARKAGRRLVLVRGPATVQRLFALTAMNESFEIVNEPAAVGATSR
jgi:anti-sigma B factor antagonist